MSLKYNPKFTNKEEILALYDRLNEEQKASIEGQEITGLIFFPPKTVKKEMKWQMPIFFRFRWKGAPFG